MISIKKSGIRALLITLFTVLIISSLVVLVKAKNSNSEVKEVEKTTVLAPVWFEYTGDPNDLQEMENPENYLPILDEDGLPTNPECNNGTLLCAVKVIPSEDAIDLPDAEELTSLLTRNQTSPNRAEIKHRD